MKARLLFKFSLCGYAILCLFCGCLRLEKSYPEKRYFMIDASRSGDRSPAGTDGVLEIFSFSVSPQYEGKGFVYITGDSRYESDFYNEFFISPSAMLTEEVRQWIAGSGLFGGVTDLSTYADASYFLEGRVTALYGDYRDPSALKAVLEMEFILTQSISAAKKPVLQNTYRKEIRLEGGSAQALVRGWNKALLSILLEFEGHIRARLESP